jgi:hypothetical protein
MIIPLGARSATVTPSNIDPYWNNVSLLVKFIDADGATTIVDSSPRTKSKYNQSGFTTKTDDFKFGTGSGYSGSRDSYYNYTADDDFKFGTGDYTIETWIKPVSGTYNSWIVGVGASPFFKYTDTDTIWAHPVAATYSFTAGVWQHLALVRASGVAYFYANGTLVGSTASTTNYTTAPNVLLGGRLYSRLDSVRITKGIARYTEAFTPPEYDFPEISS